MIDGYYDLGVFIFLLNFPITQRLSTKVVSKGA